MGKHDVDSISDRNQRRAFERALLDDVQALDRLCAAGLIESGVRRVGAEQEMFLVDGSAGPATIATDLLQMLSDRAFTTELALFNLEFNMPPKRFEGDCLRQIETELGGAVDRIRRAAAQFGADVLLTGILPTLSRSHLGLSTMTPSPRYAELNRVMSEQRGGEFRTRIGGVDELDITHDNVMLESCNTSCQFHFQVGSAEFARLYNLAQLVTAPVLAAAVNSPVLLGRRLWMETRVALFAQSLDTRPDAHRVRGSRQRVSFGEHWETSVTDIFRADITRFPVLLTAEPERSALEAIDAGEIPPLRALQLFNSTVYRWNRPCYGVDNGCAQLRIENRALPSGPTVRDEVANAAFYFGLMSQLSRTFDDVAGVLPFEAAKQNFFMAARYGLRAQLQWIDAEMDARTLILDRLLPEAEAGLRQQHVEESDIRTYLGVIEARVRSRRTGAQWILDALDELRAVGRDHARHRAVTRAMLERQRDGAPVHEWSLPGHEAEVDWRESYRTVEQVMTRDLFTVQPDALVDLAASVMEWRHVRHVPVEDSEGRLVGLISHRALLRLVARGARNAREEPVAVRDIMKANPVTVSPETPCLEAIELMRKHRVGCLPVVESGGRLVGIVSERDFMDIAERLFEERMRESDRA